MGSITAVGKHTNPMDPMGILKKIKENPSSLTISERLDPPMVNW